MQGYPPHPHHHHQQQDPYGGHYPLPHPGDPLSQHPPPQQHHLHHPQEQQQGGGKRKAAQAQLDDDEDEKPGSEAGSAGQGTTGAKGKGGASEFVKKLYKMLDDDQHHDVVSWGVDGTSFVVKDMNQFTTNILPNNFKHSNFASFVRQLNKYDFHKVKNTEEGSTRGSNPYGDNSWEFRHPNFRADMKDNLENIKRKAPSSKKAATNTAGTSRMRATGLSANGSASVDPNMGAGPSAADFQALLAQIDNLSRTQGAMQQHMTNLSQDYQAVIGEMMNFQRNMVAQDQLMQSLIQYLVNLEADQKGATGPDFQPSSQAQKLISSYTEVARASYDQMADLSRRASLSGGNFAHLPPLPPPPPNFAQFDFAPTPHQQEAARRAEYDAPPPGPPPQGAPPPQQQQQQQQPPPPQQQQQPPQQPQPSSQPVQQQSSGGQLPPPPLPQFIHPAFDLSPSSAHAPLPHPSASSSERPGGPQRRQSNVPGWAVPPRVLLVEDDAVCRKLSSKFLEVFGCQIDVAVDGVSAVNKMNVQKYDLVLMDIVMPNLDGVSATSLIRQFDPMTPIISMTSNSGANDIMTYFSHGMNDILPKPFTKENLLGMLEKHLDHLKLLQQMAEIPRALGFTDNQIQDALAQSVVVSTGAEGEQQVLNPFSSVGISDQDYVEMLQGIAMEKEGKRGLEVISGDGRARFQEVQ
ncbi:hypothetical protein JCM10213_002458 [Rhodosporidiobolus nylandii]